MNREPVLLVFDIDGTLTDSVHIHQKAFISALNHCGYKNFDTNWNNYTHHTDNYIFSRIHELQFGQQPENAECRRFEDALHKQIESETSQKPITALAGCLDFITRIRENTDIVFATGSFMKPARLKLSQSGISFLPGLLIAANDFQSREEIVSEAIKAAKQCYSRTDYKRIYAFGDGYWDYETAKNLSLEFIGIGNKKLLDHGVERFYEDFTSVSSEW